MSTRRYLDTLCVGLLWLGVAAPLEAALESRLGGAAIYDTDLDITWLANANLAATNTFGVAGINSTTIPGAMSGTTADSWIAAMNAGSYLGVSDWRRPVTLNPDASCSQGNATGTGCTGSEMGHLFYLELGGTANQSILNSNDPDVALFNNIRVVYSSSTQFQNNGYEFGFNSGFQSLASTQTQRFVWPVRGGDIALVPEPEVTWLLGSGLLILLIAVGRRKLVAQA